MASETYSFGRRSSGIFLGLDGFGLALAGGAVAVAFVALVTLGILWALLVALFAAAVLWTPTPSGEPARDLLRRLLVWGLHAVSGRVVSNPAMGFSDATATATPTPPWGDLAAHTAQDGRAVAETGKGTGEYVGVWRLTGGGDFALESEDDVSLALQRWGTTLDQLAARKAVRRAQWLVVTTPDRAAEPAAWLAQHPPVEGREEEAADYIRLLSQLGGTARRREVFLTVSVAPSKASPTAAAAELRALDRLLDQAGVFPRPLSPAELQEVLRHGADPASAPVDQLRLVQGLDPHEAGPSSVLDGPDHLEIDGHPTATLVVSELPRTPAPADWLWPLLAAQVPCSRLAVSCHLAPVPTWRAMRSAESAVASAESEMRRRQKAGFAARSRDLLALEGQAQREHEVAAGHATYVVRLAVTVSAPTPSQLRAALDEALAAIRRARCEAHSLVGGHRQGWEASLPLAKAPTGERFTATSRHLRSLYPLEAATGGTGGRGTALAVDVLSGTPFCFDPWAYYQAGILTNPSLAVFGAVGRGKSSFVKALLSRSVGVFGRRAWILDPKGEYAPLAALGLPVIALRPGGGEVKLNPLDVPQGTAPEEAVSRRSTLLQALAESLLDRPLQPEELAGLTAACWCLPPDPVLSDVVDLLLRPTEAQAERLATTPDQHALAVREVGLALGRLLEGSLAGMFDGHSTIRLSGEGGVIDLSAAWSEPSTRAPILAASLSWLTQALASGAGHPTYVVVDEAWQVLTRHGVDFLRATMKLARGLGISSLLIMHHPSDLATAGDSGSVVARRAEGLLSDTGTVVIFGDQTPIPPEVATALGLSDREVELIHNLERGRCLVCVGQRHHLVDVVLTERERALADTDAVMRAGAT